MIQRSCTGAARPRRYRRHFVVDDGVERRRWCPRRNAAGPSPSRRASARARTDRMEVGRPAARLLRAHVRHGAREKSGLCLRLGVRRHGGRDRLNPAARVRPKSTIFARPVRVTMMFSGFRSPCRMPCVVRGGKSVGDLCREVEQPLERHRAAVQFVPQRPAVDELRHDVRACRRRRRHRRP